MPRLSVIIPVLGNPAQMEDSLVSVLEHRPPDCEILVLLNSGYDDPYDLKDEVRFVEGPSESRWVDLLNIGVGLSRGAILQVLPCGVQATAEGTQEALAHFHNPEVGLVVPVVADSRNARRVLAAAARYEPNSGRLRRLARSVGATQTDYVRGVVPDPDWPVAFYRRAALMQVGQFSDKVGERLAGVDVALALAEAGFRALLEPQCRMSASSGRPNVEGNYVRGQMVERLFWRWRQGWVGSLLRHAWLVGGEALKGLYRPAGIARLAGRLAGCVQMTQAENQKRGADRPVRAPRRSTPQGPHFRSRAGKDGGAGRGMRDAGVARREDATLEEWSE